MPPSPPHRGATSEAVPGPALPRPGRGPRRRLLGLNAHLVGLVLAVLVPALAFGAAASWVALRSFGQASDARLLDTASALARAVDGEITAHLAALRVLAASPELDESGDLGRFDALARATAATLGGWIVVYRPNAVPVIHTALPFGEQPLPPGGGIGPGGGGAAIARVFQTGQAAISDLAVGRITGLPTAFALVPALRDGSVRFAVGAPVRPSGLARLLEGQAAFAGGTVTLTDRRGLIVARSRDADSMVGRPRPSREDAEPTGASGLIAGRRLEDGAALRIAYHGLAAAPGWTLWVAVPEAAFAAVRQVPMLALLAGGGLALAIGLSLATALTQRLLRPVGALVQRAEAVAAGGAAAPAPPAEAARVLEFEALRRAVERAETTLADSSRRHREVLESLGEVLYALDHDTRIRFASRRALELWRRREAEVVGRRFLEVFPQAAGSAAWEAHRAALVERREVHLCVLSPTLGRHVEIDVFPAQDGGATVTFRDVEALRAGHLAHLRAQAALRESETRLRLALEAAELGTWEVDLRRGTARRSARTLEIFGATAEELEGRFPSWHDRIHPEDRAGFDAALATVREGAADRYRVEYRLQLPDGRWRWVESHGQAVDRRPATGLPLRYVGTTQDVTARKESEERLRLLAREVDHRAKNALTVVQAALRLTPKQDAAAYARAVEGRVRALARAHGLLAEERWSGSELRAVAMGELSAFLAEGHAARDPGAPRAVLEGPPLRLRPEAVQALSMALHELATNATKHGALSAAGGLVRLSWSVDGAAGTLRLLWEESGGPSPLMQPPARRGFGTRVLEATLVDQLGGQVDREWRAEGLRCVMAVPLARVRQAAVA